MSASATILVKPSVWPSIFALAFGFIGNLPILTLMPSSRACFSVNPTRADLRLAVGAGGRVEHVERERIQARRCARRR